ncbi:hypothetical protein B0T09DRAFT_327886, partial [Sordaria sp. MPI-SDFR-AT-0083]
MGGRGRRGRPASLSFLLLPPLFVFPRRFQVSFVPRPITLAKVDLLRLPPTMCNELLTYLSVLPQYLNTDLGSSQV